MKKKLFQRLLGVGLACLMVVGAMPAAFAAENPQSASQTASLEKRADEAVGAEPEFGSVVYPTDGAGLKTILESDGNIKIQLNKNLEYRIGKKGDVESEYIPTWCTLGKGTKVIDLNGYDIKLCNDRAGFYGAWFAPTNNEPMTIFCVPSGAELVINDSKINEGEINYDGYLGVDNWSHDFMYLDQRHLIEVNGGDLTVNGGKLIAGRANKVYYSDNVEYHYRQINGTAVVLKSGDVQINGGEFRGRGFVHRPSSDNAVRDCAIKATGGKLTINDGSFWGMGCADVLQIADSVNITIKAGIFDTHKQDCDIVFSAYVNTDNHYSTSYGNTGIPARATAANLNLTTFKKDGKVMSDADRQAGKANETTNRVEVYPTERFDSMFYYETNTESWTLHPYSYNVPKVIQWDKKSKLVVGIKDRLYFPQTRSYDEGIVHTYPETTVSIGKAPTSNPVSKALGNLSSGDVGSYSDGEWFSNRAGFDLNSISSSALEDLKVGNTYYIQITAHERYEGYYSYDHLYHQAAYIELQIVEPNTIPDFNFDYTTEQGWDTAKKTSGTYVYPQFDMHPSLMEKDGMFDTFYQSYIYLDKNGSQKTIDHYSEGTVFPNYFDDARHGANYIRYQIKLTKGDTTETREVAKWVACFPCMTASVTPDSSDRYYFDADAGSKTVTLYSNANNTEGMFWTKDGVKIAGSDKAAQWTVNVSSSDKVGWYAIGYTVNGETVISEQQIYLGIKNGDRSLNYQLSSNTCTITANGDSTPTITIVPRGSGWGKITEYTWQVLSVPDGFFYTKKRKLTKATVSFAEIVGRSGNESSFYQGDYKLQCTVTDAYGNKMTTSIITITVSRPPTGLALSTYIDGYDVDVTDGFVVMAATDDWRRISANFTPENSVQESGYNVTYTSSNTSVATIDQDGFLAAQGVGSATITARYRNYTASIEVYVPKTEYSINIPESWLTPVAGEAVHRGIIGEYEDFTAELVWNVKGSYGDYEYKEETFGGNREYYPSVRIYPKKDICYPVDVEKPYNGRTDYTVDPDRYEITINGVTYYGADYCDREVFYNAPPLSQGSERYDWFQLELESTGKLIDWRDNYLDFVVIGVDTPMVGEAKTQGTDYDLPVTVKDDGVDVFMTRVSHVTDLDSIKDDDYSNDVTEDFEKYEAGETYRLYAYIFQSYSYTTPYGGKQYFTDNVQVVEPELRTITDNSGAPYNLITAYVYFTMPEEEEKTYLIGDVNFDGEIDVLDAALVQKHASGKSVLNSEQLEVADVNDDGHVDVLDAAQIQKYAAGIISEFEKKA